MLAAIDHDQLPSAARAADGHLAAADLVERDRRNRRARPEFLRHRVSSSMPN
jgi:hypothetical protein